MRANDVHKHLTKYQSQALEAMSSEAYGATTPDICAAAVERFMTEFEVLTGAADASQNGSGVSGDPPAPTGAPEQPSNEDLAGFRDKIKKYNALDDEEKALRKEAAGKRAEKGRLSGDILGFMQRHGLDDISTRQGTLRCVRRTTKAALSRTAMSERIRTFFGEDADSAEALRGNLFEGGEERETVSLRRVIPRSRN